MTQALSLDAAFAALAHPTRRALVDRLAAGEATVNELAAPFEASLPAISRHIRVLEDAGLIERRKAAQFRPCRLKPEALGAIVSWTEHVRRTWDHRFDAMDAPIDQIKDGKDD